MIERIREIEVDAGARFRSVGLNAVADDAPPDRAGLAVHIANGTVWVAQLASGALVGYAAASIVDGEGHLDQVSLIEAAAGHGIGGQLVERVCAWAASLGMHAVTLTTFRDVAWNGPYYERRGFAIVDEADCGPELRALRVRERASWLEILPRVAMRRRLGSPR